ncbi:MAG: hypothetical protein CMP10_19395 [Zetaproteobacteria bacterium]|nr:hypothetical protein [Pseudobdellovibrionaceae bacterium]
MKQWSLFLVFALLGACKSTQSTLDSDFGYGPFAFKNYSGSIVCQAGGAFKPKSVEEIVTAIKYANQNSLNVRVVSLTAPRSYSPVICPKAGGFILDLQNFNQIIEIDKAANTATVGPGILLGDLQAQLHESGFTFPVTPDYNGVSLAGSMATGAHHSSLQIPSDVASWVESIKIVNSKGELVELGKNDLAIGGVHLGLLGAIYQLKIKILPQYKLRYGYIRESDTGLEDKIQDLVGAHDYARVLWFPLQNKYILDYYDKVSTDTPGDSVNNTWTAVPNISWLGDLPVGVLNSSKLAQCGAELARVNTFSGSFDVKNSDKNRPVGFSHQMIGGSCSPGKCSWDNGIKTRTVEVGFSLARVKDWMKDVRQLMAKRKACFPVLGIYMRFSAAATSALSQARGEDTVVFEVHIPQTSNPELEPSSDVYDEMVQLTLGKYDGRPHWAKNSFPYFLGLGSKQYPNFDQFEELRQRLDPDDLFLSPFWQSVRDQDSPSRTPWCGIERTCICKEDGECGMKAKCEAGIFYKDAKICRRAAL